MHIVLCCFVLLQSYYQLPYSLGYFIGIHRYLHDCPSVSEVIVKDVGKIELLPTHNKVQQSKTNWEHIL